MTFTTTTPKDLLNTSSVQAVMATVATLRNPEHGCPWDIAQDPDTLRPFLIEEAHELLEVLQIYAELKKQRALNAPEALQSEHLPREWQAHYKEELGDLLLQVLLHSQMASDYGWFDFEEVCQTLNEKLIRRHPHVFPTHTETTVGKETDTASSRLGMTPEAVTQQWQAIKAQEQQTASNTGVTNPSDAQTIPHILANIKLSPEHPSALRYAEKLSTTAVKVGFDWENWDSLWCCVRSEIDELAAEVPETLTREALRTQTDTARLKQEDELGDLLFAVVSVAGRLKLCPETALWRASAKFKTRFEAMETLLYTHPHWVAHSKKPLTSLTFTQWDALWREAKKHTPNPFYEA